MLGRRFNALYQFLVSFAFLMLSAIGLAVIFGMMGVINLAHGEFMMLGAYFTTIAGHARGALPLAMLLGALGVGLFGAVVEIARRAPALRPAARHGGGDLGGRAYPEPGDADSDRSLDAGDLLAIRFVQRRGDELFAGTGWCLAASPWCCWSASISCS